MPHRRASGAARVVCSQPEGMNRAREGGSTQVFPSVVTPYGDQEGLGLVPVEALACCCAVVASALPAVRDVIEDKKTGLLVPAGDPAQLAEALHVLLWDKPLCARLALAGRVDVTARFDWDRIAGRYAALLDRITQRA